MPDYLIIPVRIDALILDRDTALCGPTADFSRLPYWKSSKDPVDQKDAVQDFNSDLPFLSESILTPTFAPQGFIAARGLHLHWALPDTLTRSRTARDGTIEMPAAPNRWLVSRTAGGKVQRWIVESDYLAEGDPAEPSPGATSYPAFDMAGHDTHSAALTASGFAPWKRMGRAVVADGWSEPNASGASKSYLHGLTGSKLTAMGWGDPTFAAYYPNCYSVFGFHDGPDLPGDVTYDVVGWHADSSDDILASGSKFLSDALERMRVKHAAKTVDEVWWRAVEEVLGWSSDQGLKGSKGPTRSLYCGSLHVPATRQAAPPVAAVELALGCNGMEALSSWLAKSPTRHPEARSLDQMQKAEDRLEAVQLDHDLSSRSIDVGFKFREARHEKGFTQITGGTLWSVRVPDPKPEPPGTGKVTSAVVEIALPVEAAARLNELNQHQMALDLAGQELVSLRRRLYADWCLYQRCNYPLPDDVSAYPDSNQVRAFIEEGILAEVERRQSLLAALVWQRDAAREQLEEVIPAGCEIRQRAAPRFRRPADPVLLMAGDGLRPTPRHGEDGVLECTIVTLAGDRPTPDELRALSLPDAQEWAAPWHPLLFEWEAQVQAIAEKANLDQAKPGFDPGYVAQNFELGDSTLHGVDPGEKASLKLGDTGRISGRSLFSPHAAQGFRYHLANWLLKHADPAKLPTRDQLVAWVGSDVENPGNTNTSRTDVRANRAVNARRKAADRLHNGAPVRDVQIEWIAALGWETPPPAAIGSSGQFAVAPSDPADAKLANDFGEMLALLCYLVKDAPGLQSQSLAGFHEALLGQQQVFQLPLADPLSFDDQKALVKRVSAAVADQALTAPMPFPEHVPLRAGLMRLTALRIVDTFGQHHVLVDPTHPSALPLITSETYDSGGGAPVGWARLPLRYAQAARLDFRWLSAASSDIEMNAHPASTPVCGWLLPNVLDRALQVHDSGGGVLGIIEQTTNGRLIWSPRPGVYAGSVRPETIEDRTLRKVVQWIMDPARGAQFLDKMIAALELAAENSHPAGLRAHQSLALLMGQPLAVARASLGITLQGLPAARHGWHTLHRELTRVQTAGEILLTDISYARTQIGVAQAKLQAPRLERADASAVRAALDAASTSLASAIATFEKLPFGFSNGKALQAAVAASGTALAGLGRPGNSGELRVAGEQLDRLEVTLREAATAVLAGVDRITDRFEHVQVPVRLGEWRQLDDGLAGYWRVMPDGSLADTFVGSQSSALPADVGESPSIVTHAAGVQTIAVAPSDDPVEVVMLLDPRGVVHATCGVLPTKALSIPPDQYRQAIRSLQVYFLAAPILTPVGTATVPTRQEPGHKWAWVMRDRGGQWLPGMAPAQPSTGAHFPNGQQMLDGWLRLDPALEPEPPPD